MDITYPKMLVENGLQLDLLCHKVDRTEFSVKDKIVVDKHFCAIVIQNNKVIATLKSYYSKGFKIKSIKNLKAGCLAKTTSLTIIFIRNNIDKMKVSQTPHAVDVGGVKCWLGYEFVVSMKLTKPENMWNFISQAKNVDPNTISTSNFVYLYKTTLEEMLTQHHGAFVGSVTGSTYFKENQYRAAKAVSDKMWKTYKLFGYDIQEGWTYQFTKTGRF